MNVTAKPMDRHKPMSFELRDKNLNKSTSNACRDHTKLTGTDIFDRSFPIELFIIAQRFEGWMTLCGII